MKISNTKIISHVKSQLKSNAISSNPYIFNTLKSAKIIWRSGNKIHAIKLLRNNLPMSLNDAIVYCETNFEQQVINKNEWLKEIDE